MEVQQRKLSEISPYPDNPGGPIRKSNLRRRSFDVIITRTDQRIVNDAKKRGVKSELLPPIRFHDLRHTSATLMLAQGVHPKIVQERLGHATIAVTLDTYSHVLPSMQQEAAAKMVSLLREKTA